VLLSIFIGELAKTLGYGREVLLFTVDEFHVPSQLKSLDGNDLEIARGTLALHGVLRDKGDSQIRLDRFFYRLGSWELHGHVKCHPRLFELSLYELASSRSLQWEDTGLSSELLEGNLREASKWVGGRNNKNHMVKADRLDAKPAISGGTAYETHIQNVLQNPFVDPFR